MESEIKFDNNIPVEWNEQHAKVLNELLMCFESVGVGYVILKNDKGLPYINTAKDIDIVIEPGKYKIAEEVIKKCYKNNGIKYYKVNRFERLRCWYGVDIDNHFAIHIDLLEGFLHKGFELFPFEILMKNSHKNEFGINVLDSTMSAVVLLLHSAICYHSIKDKYSEYIFEIYNADKCLFESILSFILGNNTTLKLIQLIETKEFEKIEKIGHKLSKESKLRILIKRPLFSIYNIADFLWEKSCRLIFNLNRYNKFISVQAPDGTGKSTFIKYLGEELGFFNVCSPNSLIRLYHFRPCILPNLGKVGEKTGMMKQDTNFTVPHRAKPVGKLSSFLRMTYYWLDYVIGMPIILRKNAQFDNITIFDRYIYDFIVDPFRARINLPLWLRKIFAKCVKQPQLIYILKTDAETIFKRKAELEIDEINRQLGEYDKLKNIYQNVVLLDASKYPQEIANDAIKYYIQTFYTRL